MTSNVAEPIANRKEVNANGPINCKDAFISTHAYPQIRVIPKINPPTRNFRL